MYTICGLRLANQSVSLSGEHLITNERLRQIFRVFGSFEICVLGCAVAAVVSKMPSSYRSDIINEEFICKVLKHHEREAKDVDLVISTYFTIFYSRRHKQI